MFRMNRVPCPLPFFEHCLHQILAKISFLFLVFACLFLQVHIHSPIEQKNVPQLALKAIPSAFCCGNRKPNCTLFQANNQKTSPYTLLWRWLLRSFHTFHPREEVSTHHVYLLCMHLRTSSSAGDREWPLLFCFSGYSATFASAGGRWCHPLTRELNLWLAILVVRDVTWELKGCRRRHYCS